MSRRAAIIAREDWTSPDDLARGLAWVRWLLQSVRARCSAITFNGPRSDPIRIHQAWDQHVATVVEPVIGPLVIEAWRRACAGDWQGLVDADRRLDAALEAPSAGSSAKAGSILLATTRGAKHQGVLGHYRAAAEAGSAPGHFAIAWVAVGHLFQLSLANVLAEQLRIDWQLGSRGDRPHSEPRDGNGITLLTSRLIHRSMPDLRLVSAG